MLQCIYCLCCSGGWRKWAFGASPKLVESVPSLALFCTHHPVYTFLCWRSTLVSNAFWCNWERMFNQLLSSSVLLQTCACKPCDACVLRLKKYLSCVAKAVTLWILFLTAKKYKYSFWIILQVLYMQLGNSSLLLLTSKHLHTGLSYVLFHELLSLHQGIYQSELYEVKQM